MGQLVLQKHDTVVVDDILDIATFDALSSEVATGEYHSVHAQRWDKAWRLWDGNPFRGHPVYYDPHGAFDGVGGRYPTNSSVDVLIETIRAVTQQFPTLAGAEGIDWAAIFLAPWIYPVGSALSAHCDGGKYSGSFTFFAHPRWHMNWGGELLILPPPTGPTTGPTGAGIPWLSEDAGAGATSDLGVATCVFPRPNRLVVLGPERAHMIRRVDQNAGAHVRASIAGFFLRPV